MENIVDNYRITMTRPVEDITRFRFWRAVVAEFFGTMFLTAVGCGSCLGKDWQQEGSASQMHVNIALAFGLILQAVCWSIGYDSGGHVNPAITLGVLSVGRIGYIRAIFYIVIQLVGATAGAGIVYGLTPPDKREELGLTALRKDLSVGQGIGVEIFITFILGFTVAGSCDKSRSDLGGSPPLTIGLTVTACHLFAIKYTGASMNPARSFGPAMVLLKWQNHWVYWVGPIIGGVTSTFIYETLFIAKHSRSEIALRDGTFGGDRYNFPDTEEPRFSSLGHKMSVPPADLNQSETPVDAKASNSSIDPATAEPKFSTSAEPKQSTPAAPKLSTLAEPKLSPPVEPELSTPAEPKLSLPAEPELSLPAEPKLSLPAEPKLSLPAEPKLLTPAAPKRLKPAPPKRLTPATPKRLTPAAPKLPMPAEPKLSTPAEHERDEKAE